MSTQNLVNISSIFTYKLFARALYDFSFFLCLHAGWWLEISWIKNSLYCLSEDLIGNDFWSHYTVASFQRKADITVVYRMYCTSGFPHMCAWTKIDKKILQENV